MRSAIEKAQSTKDGTIETVDLKQSDRNKKMRNAIDKIYRDSVTSHAKLAHTQSSKAFIEAAQSKSENLDKKSVARVNKDRAAYLEHIATAAV